MDNPRGSGRATVAEFNIELFGGALVLVGVVVVRLGEPAAMTGVRRQSAECAC